jgi:hypothetical protein
MVVVADFRAAVSTAVPAAVVRTLLPSTATTPADTRVMLVSEAWPSSMEPTPSAVDVEAVSPAIGRPVQLVRVPEDGVPKSGVVKDGLTRFAFNSIWSYTAFFVGTYKLPFHPTPYASSVMSPNPVVSA